MKPMREITLWILMNGLLLGGLWHGLVNGVDGALNAGLFMVWLRVAVSPFSLMTSTHHNLAKSSPSAVPSILSHTCTGAALGLLVWHGYAFTAAFFLLATFFMGFARAEADKLRSKAASATET